MTTNKPLPSLLTAFGGKFRGIQEAHIHEFIPPCIGRLEYIEMFAYSASMFFNLITRPRRAVLNDKNDRTMRFWRIIRDHPADFEKELEYCWLAPSMLAEYKQRTDEIGQAVYYYLQNKNGWCGIPSVNFHYNYNTQHVKKNVEKWKKLLNYGCVEFWDLDFREVFDRLDTAGQRRAFLYL